MFIYVVEGKKGNLTNFLLHVLLYRLSVSVSRPWLSGFLLQYPGASSLCDRHSKGTYTVYNVAHPGCCFSAHPHISHV